MPQAVVHHARAAVVDDQIVTGQVLRVADRGEPLEVVSAKGLAIGPAGELIIADEAGGGRATLAIYRQP